MRGGNHGAQEHHDAPERLSAYPFRTAQAGRQRRAGALFEHGRETGQEKTPHARQGEGGGRVLRTGPGTPGVATARRGGLMGRCRLRLRWNPRGGQEGCRNSGRTAAGRKRGGMSGDSHGGVAVLARRPAQPKVLDAGEARGGRGGLYQPTSHIFEARRASAQGRHSPLCRAGWRTLTRRAVCRTPTRQPAPPMRSCGLVRTDGASAPG